MMNLSKPTAFMLLLLNLQIANGQTLEHTPLLNTIGIKVTNINNFDSCKVAYKQTQGDAWLMAFPPDKIAINNLQQFRGSIFGLEEGTQYDVKITLYTNSNAVTLPVSQTLTLSSPDFNLTENVKWVSPDGNGNFTQNNPGNLHNLFSTNQVACGTTIVLTDGVYTANNLQLTIHNHCTENTPIMMIAAPGATPVIDGGVQVLTPWTQAPGDPNLYSTALPANADHSGICVLDNTMLYPYPSLYSTNLYYNLSDLNFGYDGFARDGNTIWIKTHTGINPNLKSVFVSKSKRFLTIYGNQKNIFLKVKGIEFRHFGKPTLNPIGSSQDAYLATVFDLRNVNHVYFDSCRFKYNTADINFSGGSNHIFIQNSSFKHDAGKWSHAMIKKSNDFNIFVSSSRGRGVETAAIFLEQAKSVVIRNNLFDGLNSAVASYVNYGLNEEVDIYNNIFVDNFDAVECDGQWSNLRVWKNEIIRPMAGISAAPPLIGPRYFYRNVIHGMQGRRNEPNDPYFIECLPVNNSYNSQAVAIKTNPKYNGIPNGNLYFFNNTIHAEDTLGFVFTIWESEWRKAVFINNCYSHQTRHPFFYFNLANNGVNGNFQIESIKDNYYSANSNSSIVKVKHIHGQYICSDIFDVDDLQSALTNISGSPNISIKNPLQVNPNFTSLHDYGFELSQSSPLINAGNVIPGFYDYVGPNPDIGAKESNFTTSVNNALNHTDVVIIYPNPSSGIFIVKLSQKSDVTTVNVFNYLGQRVFNTEDFSAQDLVLDLKKQVDGFYFVELNTGNTKIIKKILKVSF